MTLLLGLTVGCCIATWLAHARISDLQERFKNLDDYTRDSLDELSASIYGKDDAA